MKIAPSRYIKLRCCHIDNASHHADLVLAHLKTTSNLNMQPDTCDKPRGLNAHSTEARQTKEIPLATTSKKHVVNT